MAHGNAVIHADGVEFEGNASCGANGFFDQLTKLLQVHVPRDDIDVRIDDSDKRLMHIRVGDTGRLEQGPVGCS